MSKVDYEYYCSMSLDKPSFLLYDLLLKEGLPREILDKQQTQNDGRLYSPDSIFPVCTVEDGNKIVIGNMECICIHTPGHTPGHMMLYLPQSQVLFTGDHILFDITPNISIWKDVKNPLGDYINSLNKCRKIPVKIALPAHRERKEDVNIRIAQIIFHHKERLLEIMQTVRDYPECTAFEIASKITWSLQGKRWEEVSATQKWFAMGETLAHLQYLVIANCIRRKEEENKIIYIINDI